MLFKTYKMYTLYNNIETFEKDTPNKRKVSIFLFLYKIRQNP